MSLARVKGAEIARGRHLLRNGFCEHSYPRTIFDTISTCVTTYRTAWRFDQLISPSTRNPVTSIDKCIAVSFLNWLQNWARKRAIAYPLLFKLYVQCIVSARRIIGAFILCPVIKVVKIGEADNVGDNDASHFLYPSLALADPEGIYSRAFLFGHFSCQLWSSSYVHRRKHAKREALKWTLKLGPSYKQKLFVLAKDGSSGTGWLS